MLSSRLFQTTTGHEKKLVSEYGCLSGFYIIAVSALSFWLIYKVCCLDIFWPFRPYLFCFSSGTKQLSDGTASGICLLASWHIKMSPWCFLLSAGGGRGRGRWSLWSFNTETIFSHSLVMTGMCNSVPQCTQTHPHPHLNLMFIMNTCMQSILPFGQLKTDFKCYFQ